MQKKTEFEVSVITRVVVLAETDKVKGFGGVKQANVKIRQTCLVGRFCLPSGW